MYIQIVCCIMCKIYLPLKSKSMLFFRAIAEGVSQFKPRVPPDELRKDFMMLSGILQV